MKNSKSIHLVYPDIFGDARARDAMQPLSLAVLAAHTPDDWSISVFDDRIEDINYDQQCDIAAISFLTFTAKRAYEIAAEYRRRGVTVVLGGFHPSLLPDEAAEYGDVVVEGDCEVVWTRILDDYSKGCIKKRYTPGPCTNPSLIGFRRDIFSGKKYTPMVPVQIGRGCRFACDFCSVHALYGKTRVIRPVDDVVKEISEIREKFLLFTDDNIFQNEKQIIPLMDRIKGLKKRWACQISIDAAGRPELLRSLADAGCCAVFVGFESMNEDSLAEMGKSGNLSTLKYEDAVKAFKDAGLMICGAFVFGFDHDTRDSIYRAMDFAVENRFALCHFNPLYPFPKTPVYERLASEGRLLYSRWWLDPECSFGSPLFRPLNFSPDELIQLCDDARREFNSFRNIAFRSLDFSTNARSPFFFSTYLAANIISRNELGRKHWRYNKEGLK